MGGGDVFDRGLEETVWGSRGGGCALCFKWERLCHSFRT